MAIEKVLYAQMKRYETESDERFLFRVQNRFLTLKCAYNEPEISFEKGEYNPKTMKLDIYKVKTIK